MHLRKGWRAQEISMAEYAMAFLSGDWPFAYELRCLRGDRLIGVGLVDLTPHALSSVYFYHDPDWRPRAPGVFSALQELELCRTLRLDYWYVGYWIATCPSMAYKSDYGPHEVLQRYADDDETPEWHPG
jgi:arginine-tRNA-protein transferase